MRPVCNYAPFNEFLPSEHFKMENMENVRDLVESNDFRFGWDLKKAYHQIPLSKESVPYTAFWYRGRIFTVHYADFGLSILPRVCTKMIKPFLEHIRGPQHNIRCVSYLDDGLGFSESAEKCVHDANIVRRGLALFG